MRKITREQLDQAIYDYGYDEALSLFQLTEKQAENILFGQPERIRKKMTDSKQIELDILVYDLSVDENIARVISENYSALKKHYLKGDNINYLNARSETPEDLFHDALIRIMTDSERFTYNNDEDTLNFIRTRLFYERKRSRKDNIRERNKRLEMIEREHFNNLLEQLASKFNNH